MNRNIILEQMGVQQWRLREPLSASSKTTVQTDIKNEIETEAKESLTKVTELNSNHKIDSAASSSSQITEQSSEKVTQKVQNYDWPALIEQLNDKQHCDSCSKVTPIIGDGHITADWLFVFDSPTARDIEQQELLTGRVGQLFDAILVALKLDRQSIYLSTIFKCPPAENISETAALCDDLLEHQIKLVQPKVIIAFGEFTAQALIKANEDLDQLRMQTHHCFNQPIRVVPTFSLMQMLDAPLLKAKVWEDLKVAWQLVGR